MRIPRSLLIGASTIAIATTAVALALPLAAGAVSSVADEVVTPTEVSAPDAGSPAGSLVSAPTAAGRGVATADRAAADMESCANDTSQSIKASHKDDFNLIFHPCVKYNGTRVQALTTSIYRPRQAQSNPQAPEFYWFDTNLTLERGDAKSTATCRNTPKPSYYAMSIAGEIKDGWRDFPHVCYFDKTPVKGQFYRTSVAYCYDVKSDGLGTLCSPRISTGYLRA